MTQTPLRDAGFYRSKAAHIRRLARRMHQRPLIETLEELARDYDAIAGNIEAGRMELAVAGHTRLPP